MEQQPVQPVQQSEQPQQPQRQPVAPQPPVNKRSGLAIAGLIIAIIALLLAWVPILNNVIFFIAILSLIFGVVALILTKKNSTAGQGLAIATIIISVVAGIIVLATQAFYGKVIDEVGNSMQETMNDFDGTNTDQLLETSVDVTLGEFVFNPGEEAEFSFDDTTELPVTITNKSTEISSFSVKIEAVDASGVRIAEDTIYVSDLRPEQSVNEKAFQFVESEKVEALQTAEFKILQVTK